MKRIALETHFSISPIEIIPVEIYGHIFSHLNFEDLCAINIACKFFQNLLKNSDIWHTMHEDRFPNFKIKNYKLSYKKNLVTDYFLQTVIINKIQSNIKYIYQSDNMIGLGKMNELDAYLIYPQTPECAQKFQIENKLFVDIYRQTEGQGRAITIISGKSIYVSFNNGSIKKYKTSYSEDNVLPFKAFIQLTNMELSEFDIFDHYLMASSHKNCFIIKKDLTHFNTFSFEYNIKTLIPFDQKYFIQTVNKVVYLCETNSDYNLCVIKEFNLDFLIKKGVVCQNHLIILPEDSHTIFFYEIDNSQRFFKLDFPGSDIREFLYSKGDQKLYLCDIQNNFSTIDIPKEVLYYL